MAQSATLTQVQQKHFENDKEDMTYEFFLGLDCDFYNNVWNLNRNIITRSMRKYYKKRAAKFWAQYYMCNCEEYNDELTQNVMEYLINFDEKEGLKLIAY